MLPTLQNKLRQAMAGGNAPLIRRLSMLLEQHWKNATPPEPIGPGRNEPLEPRGPTLVGHSVDPQHIRDVAADDQDEYDPQGLAWGTPRIAVANATKGEDAYGTPAEALVTLIYGLQMTDETSVGIRKGIKSRDTKRQAGWTLDQKDLLRFQGAVYVPPDQAVRMEILRICHDDPLAGHFGTKKTLELTQRKYYWTKMNNDINQYVKGCDMC